MSQSKTILISTLTASLLVLAGCTAQTATNTNTVTNTNTANDNANVEVATNTNAEQGSEVDTTNWLTYTNDEYGFSFRYPEEWILNEQPNTISLQSPELVGNTYADSFTVEVTENDFDNQKKQIEDSDLIDGNLSLSKFNDDVAESSINGLAAKVGTHSTAIGLDEKYYFISLSNDGALYFEFLKPTEKVNTLIEDVVHTLKIL